MAGWATGYQDFHAVPDWTTLRPIPWLEKTALVLCDLEDEHHRPIEASPRHILRRQVERAAARGYRVYVASELEFFLFRDSYETARRKRYTGLNPIGYYAEDYHILQTTKEEFVHRDIRNGMLGAGVPVESSKGEWSAGQQEINLHYGEPVPTADDHVVYKNGAKEIAYAKGVSITFMAKYDMGQAGSSDHLRGAPWHREQAQAAAPLPRQRVRGRQPAAGAGLAARGGGGAREEQGGSRSLRRGSVRALPAHGAARARGPRQGGHELGAGAELREDLNHAAGRKGGVHHRGGDGAGARGGAPLREGGRIGRR